MIELIYESHQIRHTFPSKIKCIFCLLQYLTLIWASLHLQFVLLSSFVLLKYDDKRLEDWHQEIKTDMTEAASPSRQIRGHPSRLKGEIFATKSRVVQQKLIDWKASLHERFCVNTRKAIIAFESNRNGVIQEDKWTSRILPLLILIFVKYSVSMLSRSTIVVHVMQDGDIKGITHGNRSWNIIHVGFRHNKRLLRKIDRRLPFEWRDHDIRGLKRCDCQSTTCIMLIPWLIFGQKANNPIHGLQSKQSYQLRTTCMEHHEGWHR